MTELTVIVPVKNEAENVRELTERIFAACKAAAISFQVIFIDDNSTDNTAEIVKAFPTKLASKVVKKKGKPGKAYSVLEGSRLTDSPYIAMIDGDLQYPPELIPALYKVASEKGVAVGNRSKRHTSFLRKVVSKSYRYLFGKFLMGMDADVQSGIKVFKREIITHLSEKDVTPWTLDLPLLHTAQELGYSVGSVDMEFLERKNGQSKIRVARASTEIGVKALQMKFSARKFYQIERTGEGMIGSGVAHKRKRYITHTTLPVKNSALKTFTTAQKALILALVGLFIAGLLVNPFATALAFIAILSFIYFIDVLFSAYVLLKSLHFPPEIKVSSEQIADLDEKKLPVYSILCPLYKEAHILPQFIEAMQTLDWPKNKLEILLLLEEDDKTTIEAAQKMDLPLNVKIVVVPHSFPKTKPKACNYGLSKATGEYIVIYDAEDKPDPLQLKKVYLAFQKLGRRFGCIQCKLNYFNPTHNILTRLFTAEYSLWFDVILPGLQSIEGTIPLGGTSNHFRKEDLVALHAWDPFNVTEDADLGVRLFKNGYKTAIVDSTTLEEANSKVPNWIRQRSRWIKGYFQTYLVHMRNPIPFFREYGVHALIFQLVIGMRMTFMLINPFLWITTILYFAAYKIVGPTIESLFPPLVFYMAGFALIIGNFMYIYNYMIGCAKREHWGLIKFVFLIPFYWLLTSVAAIMALWQLITKPHYWEKTNHGLDLKIKNETDDKEHVVKTEEIINKNTGVISRLSKAKTFSGLFLIGAAFVGNFFNFLYNAYLGRSLPPEMFGVIGLIGSFLSISQIITSGIGKTVTYKSAFLLGKHEKTVKEFWVKVRARSILLSIFIALVWVLATPILMNIFKSSDPTPFVLFAPVWIIGILGAIDSGFLSGNLQFTILGITAIIESISKFLVAYILVEIGKPELVYAAVPLSMAIVFFISWMVILSLKSDPISSEHKADLVFPKSFFGASMLTKVSSVAFLSIDVLLAKIYLTPRNAGLYTLLSLVGSMIFFLGTLFAQFITPLVSHAEGAQKDSEKVFGKLLLATSFACFGGFVIFGALGQYTVPLLFGKNTLPILPLLPVYTGAMALSTIAVNIVAYHQIKNHYLFPVLSFLVSIIQIVAIVFFHDSIETLAWIMVAVNAFHLLVIGLLHEFYNPVKFFIQNVIDFVSLFKSIPNTKKISNEKLNILIFNWRDTKHMWAGGAENYIHEIAKRWVKDGNQVTIFCGNDGEQTRQETINGVNVVRRGGFYTVYIWAALYYILRFRNSFDVIIDNENGIPFFSPLYVGKPKFLLIHHIHQEVFRENLRFPFSIFAMFIEKNIMPRIYANTKVVTVSESSRKDIIKIGCSKNGTIEIVSPGIDTSIYKTKAKSSKPTFIYLGRLKKYKNVDIAIKAFAKVQQKYSEALMYIVGEGDTGRELKKLVQTLNLSESVFFTNKISDEEKIKLLGESWVALQPSSFEGWGITVIEANACGTPVIASNTNGLRDSVVDGITGNLVPVKSVSFLAKAMETLIEDKKQLSELSENAHTWAQRFDWDKTAKRFYYILETEIDKLNIDPSLIKEII